MERAKELFLAYHGSRFYMDHDGVGAEYSGYRVPGETEEQWAQECIDGFLASETQGKAAVRAYSAVTDFARIDRREEWERCLYFPLRAGHLDDATRLFMLPYSFRMAENAAKKHRFSRSEAAAYVRELDGCCRQVTDRAEKGTVTRAADYVLQEFSDPVYVAEYLDRLKKQWAGLA